MTRRPTAMRWARTWMPVVAALAALVLGACTVGTATCGDGVCQLTRRENCDTCFVDCRDRCVCGDFRCQRAAGESCTRCPEDCGECPASCGDGVCNGAEHCASCPGDCGACPLCGTWSCEGCCASDVCETGSSDTACGTGGNTCMICGAGFTCAAGECAVAASSRWNVVVEAVRVESVSSTGEAWDPPGGLPDPWVEVHIGSATGPSFSTSSGTDLLEVVFGGAAASYVRADELWILLRFDAWDADGPDGNAWIGGCDATGVGDTVFTGLTQTLECPRFSLGMQSGFTVYWHLEPS